MRSQLLRILVGHNRPSLALLHPVLRVTEVLQWVDKPHPQLQACGYCHGYLVTQWDSVKLLLLLLLLLLVQQQLVL